MHDYEQKRKYDLDLKILFEDYHIPKTHINEVPLEKLDILINKMGILIDNSKEDKRYSFNIEPIKDFINSSAETILKEINKE